MKKFLLFVFAAILTAINAWATIPDSTTFTRENIKVFPSPCNGLFNVRVDSPEEIFVIEIYDILGKQIYRNWDFISEKKYMIDLRFEPRLDVIYFAVFINSKGEKVIKRITINPQLNE